MEISTELECAKSLGAAMPDDKKHKLKNCHDNKTIIDLLRRVNGGDECRETKALVTWLDNPSHLDGFAMQQLTGELSKYLNDPNISALNSLLGNVLLLLFSQENTTKQLATQRLAIISWTTLSYEFKIVMLSVQKHGLHIADLDSPNFASIDTLDRQISSPALMSNTLLTNLSHLAALLPRTLLYHLKECLCREIKTSENADYTRIYCHLIYLSKLSIEEKEQGLQELINIMDWRNVESLVFPHLSSYLDELSQASLLYLIEGCIQTKKIDFESEPLLVECFQYLKPNNFYTMIDSLFTELSRAALDEKVKLIKQCIFNVLSHASENQRCYTLKLLHVATNREHSGYIHELIKMVSAYLSNKIIAGDFRSEREAYWVAKILLNEHVVTLDYCYLFQLLEYFTQYEDVLHQNVDQLKMAIYKLYPRNDYLQMTLIDCRFLSLLHPSQKNDLREKAVEQLKKLDILDEQHKVYKNGRLVKETVNSIIRYLNGLHYRDKILFSTIIVNKVTIDNIMNVPVLAIMELLMQLNQDGRVMREKIVAILIEKLRRYNSHFFFSRPILQMVCEVFERFPSLISEKLTSLVTELMLNSDEESIESCPKPVLFRIMEYSIPYMDPEGISKLQAVLLKNRKLLYHVGGDGFLVLVAKISAYLPIYDALLFMNNIRLAISHDLLNSDLSRLRVEALADAIKNNPESIHATINKQFYSHKLRKIIFLYGQFNECRLHKPIITPLLQNFLNKNDEKLRDFFITMTNLFSDFLCSEGINSFCYILTPFTSLMSDTIRLYVFSRVAKKIQANNIFMTPEISLFLYQVLSGLQQDAFNHKRIHKYMPELMRAMNRFHQNIPTVCVDLILNILKMNTVCESSACQKLKLHAASLVIKPKAKKQQSTIIDHRINLEQVPKYLDTTFDRVKKLQKITKNEFFQVCTKRKQKHLYQAFNKDVTLHIASFLNFKDILALAKSTAHFYQHLNALLYHHRPTVLKESLYRANEQLLMVRSYYQCQASLFLHHTVDLVLEYMTNTMFVLMSRFRQKPRMLYHDLAHVVDDTMSHEQFFRAVYQILYSSKSGFDDPNMNQDYANSLLALRNLFDGNFDDLEKPIINKQRYIPLLRSLLCHHITETRSLIKNSVKGIELTELDVHMKTHSCKYKRQYFQISLDDHTFFRPLALAVGDMVSTINPMCFQHQLLRDEYHYDLASSTLMNKIALANSIAVARQRHQLSEFLKLDAKDCKIDLVTSDVKSELANALTKSMRWQQTKALLNKEQESRVNDLISQDAANWPWGGAIHYRIGRLRKNIFGLEDEQMTQCFEQAAEDGNTRAEFELGYLIKHHSKAMRTSMSLRFPSSVSFLRLMISAASAGDDRAKVELAQLYDTYCGIDKLIVKVLEPYEVAIYQKRCTKSMNIIGFMKIFSNTLREKEIDQEALQLFQNAIELGNNDAEYNLALLLASGFGVSKDEFGADEILLDLADRGHYYATRRLARRALAQKDYDKALMWYEKCLPFDCAEANFYVAKITHEQPGKTEQKSRILSLLWNAALLGFYHGYDALGTFLVSNGETDLGVACWYRAVQKGHNGSALRLFSYFTTCHGKSYMARLPDLLSKTHEGLCDRESKQPLSLWKI